MPESLDSPQLMGAPTRSPSPQDNTLDLILTIVAFVAVGMLGMAQPLCGYFGLIVVAVALASGLTWRLGNRGSDMTDGQLGRVALAALLTPLVVFATLLVGNLVGVILTFPVAFRLVFEDTVPREVALGYAAFATAFVTPLVARIAVVGPVVAHEGLGFAASIARGWRLGSRRTVLLSAPWFLVAGANWVVLAISTLEDGAMRSGWSVLWFPILGLLCVGLTVGSYGFLSRTDPSLDGRDVPSRRWFAPMTHK